MAQKISPRWIREREAADHLGVSVVLLRKWRWQTRRTGQQVGPPFIWISHRCVRYSRSALLAWQEEFERSAKPAAFRPKTELQRQKMSAGQRLRRMRNGSAKKAIPLSRRPN